MAVPAEIRAVPRPKNTIVDDNGCEGPNRYPVREQASSKYVPGAAMSRSSICKLLQHIGQSGSRRKEFYQRRLLAAATDHHIAIDGTPKQDQG